MTHNHNSRTQLSITPVLIATSPLVPILYIYIYRVCQKKKDILNIHIKSEGINIFSQKFCWTESTIFAVKYQKFTFIVQLFMT